MKLFIFSMLMIIGMGNVMGQTYSVCFYAGENWHNGYTDISSTNWISDPRNPKLSMIAGDTILVGCKENSDFTIVNWYTDLGVFVAQDSIIEFILQPDFSFPVVLQWTDLFGNSIGNGATFWTKFIPSPIIVDTTGYKSSNETLSLTDFNVGINTSLPGAGDAYCDSIIWFKNGIPIDSTAGENTSIVINSNGNYSIKVKVAYVTSFAGINDTIYRFEYSNTITISSITGIVDLESYENIIRTYPNPVSDILYISEEVEYEIYSISGNKIMSGEGKEINVSNYERGVYIIKTPIGSSQFVIQ